jgi:hypothetical protein
MATLADGWGGDDNERDGAVGLAWKQSRRRLPKRPAAMLRPTKT